MADKGPEPMDDAALDDAIRRLLDAAVSDSPEAPTLAGAPLLASVPPARRVAWRSLTVAAAALAVVIGALVVVAGGTGNESSSSAGLVATVAPTTSVSPDVSTTAVESRPVGLVSEEGCVEQYSMETLAGRAWGFDGTVRSIEPFTISGLLPFDAAVVEFEVHEWFGIQGPAVITIDMTAPQRTSSEEVSDYGVGSRLLVSGEPRLGGEPLDDPVAWSCGFTRTWNESTALAWRATVATRPEAPTTGDSLTTRIELSRSEAEPGDPIEGWLVVWNGTGEPLEILDRGCAPKWTVVLSNRFVPPGVAFQMDCAFQPLVIEPGETRLPVSILTRFPGCSGEEHEALGGCPFLPAGDYYAVFAGSLPGLPTPAPVPVRLTEPTG